MNNRVTIREAEEKDLDELAAMAGELFSMESDFPVDHEQQKRGFSRLLETDADVLIAELDQEIVGMITLQYLISTAMGGSSALVEDVFVKAPFRGQQVGASLLSAADKAALSKGCVRMQLVADLDNSRAHRFYEKYQWQPMNLCSYKKLL
jgi:GNAT superfamily N-acetyltransferase